MTSGLMAGAWRARAQLPAGVLLDIDVRELEAELVAIHSNIGVACDQGGVVTIESHSGVAGDYGLVIQPA